MLEACEIWILRQWKAYHRYHGWIKMINDKVQEKIWEDLCTTISERNRTWLGRCVVERQSFEVVSRRKNVTGKELWVEMGCRQYQHHNGWSELWWTEAMCRWSSHRLESGSVINVLYSRISPEEDIFSTSGLLRSHHLDLSQRTLVCWCWSHNLQEQCCFEHPCWTELYSSKHLLLKTFLFRQTLMLCGAILFYFISLFHLILTVSKGSCISVQHVCSLSNQCSLQISIDDCDDDVFLCLVPIYVIMHSHMPEVICIARVLRCDLHCTCAQVLLALVTQW